MVNRGMYGHFDFFLLKDPNELMNDSKSHQQMIEARHDIWFILFIDKR